MLYKCLPQSDLRRVMAVRWFLDYLAAYQTLLLKRSWGDFKAIYRARRDFKRWKKDFANDRLQIQRERVTHDDYTPMMLLWQYYVRGCHTFEKLTKAIRGDRARL